MRWNGVIGFPVTPMDADGDNVHMDAFRQVVRHMISGGVPALGILGSTSEYAYLTDHERRLVIETSIEEAHGDVAVVVGVSAVTTKAALDNIAQANEMGADAIFLGVPTYFPLTRDELLRHLETLVTATELPVCLYNNPGTSKIDMTPEIVERLSQFQQVQAIKEDSGNIDRVNTLSSMTTESFTVLAGGYDPIAFPSFALGAEGWCTALPNLLPAECVELHRLAVVEKNLVEAGRLHQRLLPVARILGEHNLASVVKAGVAALGIDAGSPRPPLSPTDGERVSRLKQALKTVDRESVGD